MMHRSHQNLVPVSNKYLDHKRLIKDQETHRHNIKSMRSSMDLSPPTPRSHCNDRLKQKQMRQYELDLIHHENERLQQRMVANGSFVDAKNNYVFHSLNQEKRHREEKEHQHEIKRLQKQIQHARSSYSIRECQGDYNKQLDYQRLITRYPFETKK